MPCGGGFSRGLPGNAPGASREESYGLDFTLYPNPARDEIYLGLDAFLGRPFSLPIPEGH